MLGVAWFHWTPPTWQGPFPFPIGIYFFFVLTGFLITGGLLRDRDRGESSAAPWRAAALKNFLFRRGLRILAPYYAAMMLGWIFRAQDLSHAPWWYLLHLSNWHMAMHGWADFTAHFWTLAVQQQFYVIWPLVIWWLPRRMLAPAMLLGVALAPLTRLLTPWLEQGFVIPSIITPNLFDYLGLGSLLALAVHRGMPLDHKGLRRISLLCAAAYATLYCGKLAGHNLPGIFPVYQTLLAVACCGLVAAAAVGFTGWRQAVLTNPAIQHIGRLSYSLYLFHNFAPVMDSVLSFCRLDWAFHGPGMLVRLAVLALFSWAIAWLSWRFIETPLSKLKSSLAPAA